MKTVPAPVAYISLLFVSYPILRLAIGAIFTGTCPQNLNQMFKNFNLAVTAAAAFALLFVIACKKDDNSPQKMILGKWRFISEYDAQFVNGQLEKDTIIGYSDEYYDFRSDGKVYMYYYPDYDTFPYKVVNASTLIFDGDTATIKTFTDKKLVLYDKAVYGQNWYEATFNLEK